MPAGVGVDSYSYHRLLGEVRPGETPTLHLFPRGSLDVVAEARRLEPRLRAPADELPRRSRPDSRPPRSSPRPDGVALGLSWGAREGLEFGERADALQSLLAWLEPAAELGLPVMRIVAGGPAHRGEPAGRVAGLLREACAAARDHGLRLALENHGDLTADELERLVEQVGRPPRLLRHGQRAPRRRRRRGSGRRLAPAIEILHLKDCRVVGRSASRAPCRCRSARA